MGEVLESMAETFKADGMVEGEGSVANGGCSILGVRVCQAQKVRIKKQWEICTEW